MSRGRGRLESAIFDALGDGKERSVNKLIWDLATSIGAVKAGKEDVGAGLRTGIIDNAFYSGTRRALKSLRDHGEIAILSRRLATEEVVEIYPYKTTRLEVLELRKLVLPQLVSFGRRHTGIERSDMEERILAKISGTDRHSECQRLWADIEERLWRAGQDPQIRKAVHPLLVAGMTHFSLQQTEPTVVGSFHQYLPAACAAVDANLSQALARLNALAFPTAAVGSLEAKSVLFGVARFEKNGGAIQLADAALLHLLEKLPDVVTKLRGFQPAVPRERAKNKIKWFQEGQDPVFPDVLVRIVNRQVFEAFEFAKRAPFEQRRRSSSR